jgi:acetyltransferase-like isoleucine patch superfamily enzyme
VKPSVAERLARLRHELAVARDLRRHTSPPLPARFAHYGAGSVIVPPARVNNPDCISIGDGVVIHEHAWLAVYRKHGDLAPHLSIGDRTRIGRFAHIACVGDIRIGEDVLTADMIFIGDTHHGFDDADEPISRQPMAVPKPVVIERGAFLGIRATVLEGVTIGENAYVAAGAVVTEDVEPRTIVVGNPARPVKRWDASADAWVSTTFR